MKLLQMQASKEDKPVIDTVQLKESKNKFARGKTEKTGAAGPQLTLYLPVLGLPLPLPI
jgi:hypothetical protein